MSVGIDFLRVGLDFLRVGIIFTGLGGFFRSVHIKILKSQKSRKSNIKSRNDFATFVIFMGAIYLLSLIQHLARLQNYTTKTIDSSYSPRAGGEFLTHDS